MAWLLLAVLPACLCAGEDLDMPALAELKAAAEGGDAIAQDKLGAACVAAFDFSQAEHWFRKAAQNGVAASEWQLGKLLLTGRPKMSGEKPVEKNPKEAIGLLTKAAQQGHLRAQLELGHCYRDGTEVAKDPIEAYKWYRLASEQDGILGKHYLDSLILAMSSDQIADGQRRAGNFRVSRETSEPAALPVQAENLRLEGLMGFKEHRQAVINHRVFTAGDEQLVQAEGRTVKLRCVAIRDDSVQVRVIEQGAVAEFWLRRK